MGTPRERILETAARLFTERGYEEVGINEIIAKAGVAKASFYQHFPSKQTLCAVWLAEELAAQERHHEEVLASRASVPRRVGREFEALERWAEGHCFRGCPFSITAAMGRAGKESREVIRRYTEARRRFWQALARALTGTAAQARDLGDAWFLLHSGALGQAQNTGATWPITQARKIALQLAKTAAEATAARR